MNFPEWTNQIHWTGIWWLNGFSCTLWENHWVSIQYANLWIFLCIKLCEQWFMKHRNHAVSFIYFSSKHLDFPIRPSTHTPTQKHSLFVRQQYTYLNQKQFNRIIFHRILSVWILFVMSHLTISYGPKSHVDQTKHLILNRIDAKTFLISN